MKTFESICIGCGEKIEFEYYEFGDIVEEDSVDGYEITDEVETGWWDYKCPHCGWYTSCDSVEEIVGDDLGGFCTCLDTGAQVRNLIRAVLKRHPILIAEIQTELEHERGGLPELGSSC